MIKGYDEVDEDEQHNHLEEEDLVFSTPTNLGGHQHIRFCGKVFNRKKFIGVSLLLGITIAVILGAILTLTLAHPKQPLSSDLEQVFLQGIVPDTIRQQMVNYSSLPHIAGSINDHNTALYTLQKFQEYGLDARIDEIPVYLSYPVERQVQVVYPPSLVYNCSLEEAVVDDGTSGVSGAIPTWNGYSGSGDVTGELIYANYGREEDYQALVALNVNFTGKVVIVRYGEIFRGNKAQLAAELGAVAVLIYVDPSDTGYLRGPVYPEGPWSSNTTVQRGSVWVGNGDPLTPGWPSSETAPRITPEQAFLNEFSYDNNSGLPTIPIQPLSYGDAAYLFAGLNQGVTIPDPSWAGGFNVSYVGPGEVQVRVNVQVSYNVTPIWNVIGRINGTVEPDRLVLFGAHRDAWTFGAGDPISGTSVLMEVARNFGELLKQGWQPRRTIVFLSWDAEEYGLIGSVEFAEKYEKLLLEQALVYLNLDVAVEGQDYFTLSGVPSLLNFFKQVTQEVQLNSTHTVYQAWPGQEMNLLGSGSDYTAFIQHLGITSIDGGFDDDSGSYEAVYHSNYDSIYWFNTFGDPDFSRHAAIAKVWGLAAIRIADYAILPFEFTEYANTLQELVAGIQALSPSTDFSLMTASISRFNASAQYIASQIANVDPDSQPLIARGINDRLFLTERAFLGDSSLTGRPWYNHVIFAPSISDAYAGVAFPTIQDALTSNAGNGTEALFLINRISQMIDGAAMYLKGTL